MHKIVLPNSYKSNGDEEIGVSLQRGNRTTTTSFHRVDPKSCEVLIDESLSVICTMYSTTNSRNEISYQVRHCMRNIHLTSPLHPAEAMQTVLAKQKRREERHSSGRSLPLS